MLARIIETIKNFWAGGILNQVIVIAGGVVFLAFAFKVIKASLKVLFYVSLIVFVAAVAIFLFLRFF